MSAGTDISITTAISGGDGAGEHSAQLLLLHGFGSNEADLAGLASYLPELPWTSLRAPLAAGNGGYAWFPISTPGQPDPEPVLESTAAVLAWLDANIPADQPVIPLGFSQGGLMVTQLLRARPQRFAAGVVLAGFVLGGSALGGTAPGGTAPGGSAEQPGDAELALSRPPVFYGRGDSDPIITADAVARTEEWLPAHSALTAVVYPGLGHAVSAELLADVSRFIEGVTASSNG